MSDTPIFARIRKLLALADASKNSSEAEATLAAAKVQEMLQDYGLTLAQVEASGGSTDASVSRETKVTDRAAMYQWQRSLMASIADNYFCLHHLRTVEAVTRGKQRRSKRHLLVGRSMNVEVAISMYDYLAATMRRLAEAEGYDHAENESDHHLFLDGATSRICERLADIRRRKEQEQAEREAQRTAGNGSGRELVLADVYGSEADLNNDALNHFVPGTTAAKRRERAADQAAKDARYKELVAEGTEDTEAWYLAHGYGAEDAKLYAASYNKIQAKRTRSRSRGRSQNWTQGNQKEYRKQQSEAYQSGRSAGDGVGLDDQVTGSNRKTLK